MRFLFYSHDGVGLGHTRRNLAIASALARLVPDSAILLASGCNEIHRLGLPHNVSILKLPGLYKLANDKYRPRRLQIPEADLWELRSSLLATAVSAFRPDVLVADKHPLGVNTELRPALECHRANGGKTVLGLRDILDAPAIVRADWERNDLYQRITEFYDTVLVYGQRNVFDSVAHYDFPSALAERTRFCNYVVNGVDRHDDEDDDRSCLSGVARPVVLATVGGGEDGSGMLRHFIRTSAGAPWTSIVVTGPMASPDEHEELRRLSEAAGIRFCGFMNRLAHRLAEVDALVCMGGYNTLLVAVSSGTPTVCVPRVTPRTEQLLRAQASARLGLLRVVEPAQLDESRLRSEIAGALGVSRRELASRVAATIRLDGAHQAAQHVLDLARRRELVSS